MGGGGNFVSGDFCRWLFRAERNSNLFRKSGALYNPIISNIASSSAPIKVFGRVCTNVARITESCSTDGGNGAHLKRKILRQ